MPYKLVAHASGDKYFVVSPHGHYLSKQPMSHDDALKQETAVRLTENADKLNIDKKGLPWTPAPRDAVHEHGIIKTSDIFAPLPLPVPRVGMKK